MGTLLTVGRHKFTMSRANEAPAVAALKQAHEKAGFSVSIRADGSDDIEAANSFEEAMLGIGWQIRRANGVVRGLRWIWEKSTVDEQERVFAVIAPFVDRGSFVELEDDSENQPIKLAFDGRRCVARPIEQLGQEEDVLEDEDRLADKSASILPSFASLSQTMPDGRQPYSISMTLVVGDWLEHPSFGPGMAVAKTDRQKVQVLFEAGLKVLKVGEVK